MRLEKTRIPEVILLHPQVHQDSRGYFFEVFKTSHFQTLGLPTDYVQDNEAKSQKGVLRGLHYQLRHAQGKLVRVVQGAVFDVAVDIRQGSPTFGQWVGFELTGENHLQAFIPEGFAHGYMVLSPEAVFQYKCTREYAPEDEYGIKWDDPRLAIDWPSGSKIVSSKDFGLPLLSEIDPNFLPHCVKSSGHL